MYGFVYITRNKIDGKQYIGKCEYNRKNGWRNYLGSGVYLKRAINKYGKENFEREIIQEYKDKDSLEKGEEYWIKYYNAVEDENFYNLKLTSIGGDTFTNHPEKERIRKLKSENSKGKNNPMYGVEKTEDMIQSVKKANSRKIRIDGVEYPSTAEASRQLDINASTITYRLDSKNFENYERLDDRKVVSISRTEKSQKALEETHRKNKKPIRIDGVRYESATDASKQLSIPTQTIYSRLKSKNFKNYERIKE